MFWKWFGTNNDRVLKKLRPAVDAINALEPEIQRLSDHELRGRTAAFRERLAKGETLDSLMVEAFATVREGAKRALGQRHFDVQLMGGMILHQGKIAEMKTGEGKTLVSTLAAYLNALAGKGVHIVTVNDYLARRDAEWMGQIYKRLGMTVGCVVHGLDDNQRRDAYASDITYGTNNELGFDFLREAAPLVHEGIHMVLFGGDGTPLFDQKGYASVRIFKKLEDGTNLIFQVGHMYPSGVEAGNAVKDFFAQWDESPFHLVERYGAAFGAA